MNKKKAILNYKANTFDIIEDGDHVVCAISQKKNIFRKFKLLECRSPRSILFTSRGEYKI